MATVHCSSLAKNCFIESQIGNEQHISIELYYHFNRIIQIAYYQ